MNALLRYNQIVSCKKNIVSCKREFFKLAVPRVYIATPFELEEQSAPSGLIRSHFLMNQMTILLVQYKYNQLPNGKSLYKVLSTQQTKDLFHFSLAPIRDDISSLKLIDDYYIP